MKKRKISGLLAAMALAAVILAGLSACAKKELVPDKVPQEFRYQTTVFGAKDSQRILLDSLTAAITDIANSASWLKATAVQNDDRHAIDIVSTSPETDMAEATLTVTDADGNHAQVTVYHRPHDRSDTDSGVNSDWIKEWWTFDQVVLYGIPIVHQEDPQLTPWKVEGTGHIPDKVRLQYKPSQGWEMAFSCLNDPARFDTRYFALYNKFTGQMRVYTYVKDPSGWGSDFLFQIFFGEPDHTDMYPLYHINEYGIPTCHVAGETLLQNAKLVTKQSQTFQAWIAPYRYTDSVSGGWYCIEFDMSGYVPKGRDWLKKDLDQARMKIFPRTNSKEHIGLRGSLLGKVAGEFQSDQYITHGGANALSGIFNAIGSGFSTIGGMADSSIKSGASYANVMKNVSAGSIGEKLNPIKYWGGFACNVAGGLFSSLSGLFDDPQTVEYVPGKIDLALDATMELDGYIDGVTSNNHQSISVSADMIYKANGDEGHVGKGVWGLAEDPVVYIDKDDIISSQNGFNLLCTKDGYANDSFHNYDARIVYAFDPTSVKLNFNDELFHEIRDVTVTTNVGVFPNLAYGNTDRYREMLMLGERPGFSLADGKTSGTVTLNARSTPVVTRVGLNELADNDYEKADNCSVFVQNKNEKGWQRYHGRLIDVPKLGKQIIIDPQVYIPYTMDGDKCTGIGFPASPDFVVRVDVQFTAMVDVVDDEGNKSQKRQGFQFGKLFIPQVKVVDYKQMCEVYARLKDYSKNCMTGQSYHLASDSTVPVYYPDGDKLIGKSLRLLERICE